MANRSFWVITVGLMIFGAGIVFADSWCPQHGRYTADSCPQYHEPSRYNGYTDENTNTSTHTYDIYRSGNWSVQGQYQSKPLDTQDPRYESEQEKQKDSPFYNGTPTDSSGELKFKYQF